MAVYLLRRYGPIAFVAFVLVDLIVAYLVGSRLLEWEMEQIRTAWND